MARVKGPPLFIPHTWLKALRVNRHNLFLGMGPSLTLGLFSFLIPYSFFLFPSLPLRKDPNIEPISRDLNLSPWAPPTFGFA
jgi:hypothetical protein